MVCKQLYSKLLLCRIKQLQPKHCKTITWGIPITKSVTRVLNSVQSMGHKLSIVQYIQQYDSGP